MTTRGERDLAAAADVDADTLRRNWSSLYERYSIPRPVGVSTFVLHRPPSARTRSGETQFVTARFDDPHTIPRHIERLYPDLTASTWRFYPSDGTTALSRTWEGVSGAHFVILDARERSARDFIAGIIELVITADEDESSMAFCAVLPTSLTWWHVWSWLRLGTGFAENSQYRLVLDGTTITDPMARISPRTGFFAQITMVTVPPATFVGIPTMRARSLRGDLCFGLPSGVGTVYRAGFYAQDSVAARLPYEDRDAAITRRWTDLTVWSSSRVHPTGRGRHPPWHRTDSVLVHPHPDGIRVVVLVTLFEGSGGDDYALILHRHSSVVALYQALGCHFRCISPDYECTIMVNLQPFTYTSILHLEDGDYVEVFVIHRRVHPGVFSLLTSQPVQPPQVIEGGNEYSESPGLSVAAPSTLVGLDARRVRKLTAVSIHTEGNLDLRSDAAPEESYGRYDRRFSLDSVYPEIHTSLPNSRSPGFQEPTAELISLTERGLSACEFDAVVFMQRSASSSSPTRIHMRFVGLHGFADSRIVDMSQSLTSQLEDGWSRI